LINGYDTGDQVLENVEINLYDAEADTLVASTYSDAFGRYLFTRLRQGSYYVEFIAPLSFYFIEPNAISNDTEDSDAIDGISQVINLGIGENDLTIDAGFYKSSTVALSEVSLEAWALEDGNNLEWSTYEESNTDIHLVMRSRSIEYDQFVEIAQVKANFASENNTYNYLDRNPLEGINYYKIGVRDLNGDIDYSNTIAIEYRSKDTREIRVYPNPTFSTFRIEVNAGDYEINTSVLSPLGEMIFDLGGRGSHDYYNVDLTGMPAGPYLVRVAIGEKIFFEKITKID